MILMSSASRAAALRRASLFGGTGVQIMIDPFSAGLMAAGARLLAKKVECRCCSNFSFIQMDPCCGGTICKPCLIRAVENDGMFNVVSCPICGSRWKVRRS